MASTPATPAAAAPVAPLVLEIAGQKLPLLHFTSQKGNDCFGVLAKKANGERYLSKYGVGIPALGDDLPLKGSIVAADGSKVDLALELGMTESGNRKVSFSGSKEVPGQGSRMVRVNISQTKSGWNVIAKVIPMGEGGGKVTSLADLW